MTPEQQPSRRGRWPLVLLAGLAIGGAVLLHLSSGEAPAPPPLPASPPEASSEDAALWERMAAAEELIARLDFRLAELAFAVQNLEFPDDRTREQFWPFDLRIADIGPEPPETLPLRAASWPMGATRTEVSAADLSLWRPLLERVDYFESAKLRVKKGDFAPDVQEGVLLPGKGEIGKILRVGR